MTIRIALSPSTQTWNEYPDGSNEQQHTLAMAEVCARVLRAAGIDAQIMRAGLDNPGTGYVAQANQSNATGPYDAHICFHTDAGGATGTTAFYYPGSDVSRLLAQSIYDQIAPISPGQDYGVRSRSDLYELNATTAPAVLIEAAPHDRQESATWLINNPELIGNAYAVGIMNWLGIKNRKRTMDENDVKRIVAAIMRAHPRDYLPADVVTKTAAIPAEFFNEYRSHVISATRQVESVKNAINALDNGSGNVDSLRAAFSDFLSTIQLTIDVK